MKKFFTTVALILTTITGLFAEGKWNIEYRIRTVTPDEFYLTVKKKSTLAGIRLVDRWGTG